MTITVHGTRGRAGDHVWDAVRVDNATRADRRRRDAIAELGAVTFTDVDLSDIETSSITNTQVGATLANGYTLTAAQQTRW